MSSMSETVTENEHVVHFNPAISKTMQITLKNGEKKIVNGQIDALRVEKTAYEWMIKKLRSKNTDAGYPVKYNRHIQTWEQYATESLNGYIFNHFHLIGVVKTEKLSIISDCIHNQFGGVEQCITKLKSALYGTVIDFVDFDSNHHNLCYDCLLHLCSQKTFIQQLFDDYYNDYINWYSCDDVLRKKGLLYLSNLLLKYPLFVKYVLKNDKLYKKIFELFIYYLKNFQKLKKAKINEWKQCIVPTDHGYTLRNSSILAIYFFEYNLLGIVSCIDKFMTYCNCIHFSYLLQMKYFVYFQRFFNEYFALDHIKIIIKMNKPKLPLIIHGSCSIWFLLSIVEFIGYRINNNIKLLKMIIQKIHVKSNGLKKFICKSEEISEFVNNISNNPTLAPVYKCFDGNSCLKDKYMYMYFSFGLRSHSYFGVKNVIKQLRKHRKYKICGDNHCKCNNRRIKRKVCSQCALIYYCSRKCQKRNWIHHKKLCSRFAL